MKKENELSEKIWLFLPSAIRRVIHSYNQFASKSMPDDAKEFSTHHGACKSALQHLEALLKIMKTSPFNEGDKHKDDILDLSILIKEAQISLEDYKE